MKMRWVLTLLVLAGLATSNALASGFGFTFTDAAVVNTDYNGNNKADVGDEFAITGATFSSYLSSGGAPAINDNDLDRYSFDFDGTATEVVGSEVLYEGGFSITYTGPAYPSGIVVETGQAKLWAVYDTSNGSAVIRGLFQANPGVEPAAQADPNFENTDFAPYNSGRFFGIYAPTPGNPGTGAISGNLNAGREGFAASLHNAVIVNDDANSNGVADVGETFVLTAPIAAYYPQDSDSMLLPLNHNDLPNYEFIINGEAVSIVGLTVNYTGTYALRYTGPAYPGGVDVETGTVKLVARYNENLSRAAKLTGELIATAGVPAELQSDPFFKNSDFAVFNPGRFNGTYLPDSPGAATGTVSGSLAGGVLGFSATVGSGTIVNGDENSNGIADVGETFQATGPLSAYMAVGAPPLLDKDLNRYTIGLDGLVTAVVGTTVTYEGDFTITYTGPITAVIETGTFTITAEYSNGTATLSGTFVADSGANTPNAPFQSTDYAPFNPATFTGFYRSAGLAGTFYGNLTSGALVQALASRRVGEAIEGSPTAATTSQDARRALVVSGSTLFVIDPATGFDAPGWEGGKTIEGRVIGSGRPAVLGDQVFVGTDTGMLYRFDLITGDLLNAGRPGGAGSRILTTPAPVEAGEVDQVIVAISNLNGGQASAILRVAADNLNTPTAGPQVLSPTAITTSSPAVPLNGNIYVGSNAGLFILNDADLTIKSQTADTVVTSPLVANGLVWLATGNGAAFRTLNAGTGNPVSATLLTSPLVIGAFNDQKNGLVYAGVYDGRVHAFEQDGAYAGLVLPGLFNPENTSESWSMPVAANSLMFRATQNKQVLFGLPINGDSQGTVDLVTPIQGAMAATGQLPGQDFVIGSTADGFIHTMTLPGAEVADVPGPVELLNLPMDEQVNLGITTNSTSPNGDAIYIPDSFTETLSFQSDETGGFTRVSITGGGWYYGPYIDVNLLGLPGVDVSKPGTTFEFDARYFQPEDNANRYGDAPIFVRVYSYANNNATLTGYRDYGIVYATQGGDEPYPSWTTVVVDANDPTATTTDTSAELTFDPSNVTRIRLYGTDWYSPAGQFKSFIDVKNFKVIQQP